MLKFVFNFTFPLWNLPYRWWDQSKCHPGIWTSQVPRRFVSSFGCGISCIVLFSVSCWHNLTYRFQSLVWGCCLPVYFHSVEWSSASALLNLDSYHFPPKQGRCESKQKKANTVEASQQGLSDFSAQQQPTRDDSELEAGWRTGRDTCLGPADLILHSVTLLWDVEFRNSDITGPMHQLQIKSI